jgi:hypothetical protein
MLNLIGNTLWFGSFIFNLFLGHNPQISNFHPIHVSTANIEYNKQDHKWEVTCTIFTDDFEAALVKQYHSKIDLNSPAMHTAMDALVKSYLQQNLQLKTDGKTTPLTYLGFEINKESADVFLESDVINNIKKVEVNDGLLQNQFDDQINIVHITVNGTRKSEKLDYPNKKVEQIF